MNKKLTKTPDWIFSFLLIFVPFLIIYLCLSPDIWTPPVIEYKWLVIIGFGYWLFVSLCSILFLYLKMVNFSFPFYSIILSLSFWILIISSPLTEQGQNGWRAVIIIISILLIIPSLILKNYFEKRLNKTYKTKGNKKRFTKK